MIVEIEKPAVSAFPALDYNEGKVEQGVAELLAIANLDSDNKDYIYDVFDDYSHTYRPIACLGFHASVNPGDDDRCSEEQILKFIEGMMENLGYGEQPYLIYRHHDIERQHYHVVSIRADKNGHKISDWQERKRCRDFMKSVSEKYSFNVIEKNSVKHNTRQYKGKSRRFNPKGGHVEDQVIAIVTDALNYSFHTQDQYFAVLKSMGVGVKLMPSEEGTRICFCGLDYKNHETTRYMSSRQLGISHPKSIFSSYENFMDAINDKCEYYKSRPSIRDDRDSLYDILKKYSGARSNSFGERDFREKLKQHNITQVTTYDRWGEVKDVYLICGEKRKVVLNLRDDVQPSSLVMTHVIKGRLRLSDLKHGRSVSSVNRVVTSLCRNIGPVLKLLAPINPPQTNVSAGSSEQPKTEEELREEYLIGQTGAINSKLDYSPSMKLG